MKLTQLTAKPQLVKVELNDEAIIKEFGEALEFWIWDRQPMDKFVKLAKVQSDNFSELVSLVNEMVLDEAGNPVVKGDDVLPTHVMTRVIGKVVETLGK